MDILTAIQTHNWEILTDLLENYDDDTIILNIFLGHQGTDCVVNMINKHKKLKNLLISNASINADDIENIVNAVKTNKTIEYLSIHDDDAEYDSSKFLNEILKNNSVIKTIEFDGKNIEKIRFNLNE